MANIVNTAKYLWIMLNNMLLLMRLKPLQKGQFKTQQKQPVIRLVIKLQIK